MNFLTKLGKIIATVAGIFTGFQPIIEKTFPQSSGITQVISKDLTEVATVVANVEAVGQLKGMTGPDKAKAAGPLVAQILLNSALMAGKKVADPAGFQQGCVNIAGGVADVLNSLHESSTPTVSIPT